MNTSSTQAGARPSNQSCLHQFSPTWPALAHLARDNLAHPPHFPPSRPSVTLRPLSFSARSRLRFSALPLPPTSRTPALARNHDICCPENPMLSGALPRSTSCYSPAHVVAAPFSAQHLLGRYTLNRRLTCRTFTPNIFAASFWLGCRACRDTDSFLSAVASLPACSLLCRLVVELVETHG